MSALRAVIGQVLRREDDDAPVAARTRRDWIVDTVLFLFAAMAALSSVKTSARHGLHDPMLGVDAIAAALACLALWWRRRWPLGVGLAVLGLLVVSPATGVAAGVTLYTVAAYRRWQLACLVAAAQVALLPLARAVQPQGVSPAVYYLGGVLGPAIFVAWGMFRRTRRQAQRERAGRAEAVEQLRVEQIRYAERTRIAREMHDVLAHRISLLSLHAGVLEFRPDAPPDEVARAAGVIRASAHQALEDLRAVIGVLRDGPGGQGPQSQPPQPQPPQPTLAALPELLAESRAAGMSIQAEVSLPDLAAVPDAIGRHALRIVQEALTNARKHATTAPVELRLSGAPWLGLTIEVRNPVPALATAESKIPGTGAGLLGLAERAALSGGRLEHGLDDHGDFRLRAWLPWPR